MVSQAITLGGSRNYQVDYF